MTLSHDRTDRLPCYCWGSPVSGTMLPTGANLKPYYPLYQPLTQLCHLMLRRAISAQICLLPSSANKSTSRDSPCGNAQRRHRKLDVLSGCAWLDREIHVRFLSCIIGTIIFGGRVPAIQRHVPDLAKLRCTTAYNNDMFRYLSLRGETVQIGAGGDRDERYRWLRRDTHSCHSCHPG